MAVETAIELNVQLPAVYGANETPMEEFCKGLNAFDLLEASIIFRAGDVRSANNRGLPLPVLVAAAP